MNARCLVLVLAVQFQGIGICAPTEQPLRHDMDEIHPVVPAETLHLKNLDKSFTDLKDLRGKVVVVNFWASYCPPCRRELKSLQRLQDKTQGQGIEVLAVNIGEPARRVRYYLRKIDTWVTLPVLLNRDPRVLRRWKVRGLPTTYVVDAQGMLRFKAVGERAFDHAVMIKALLKLKGGST